MGQIIDVKITGLQTNNNPLSESSLGTLSIAKNAVVDRPSIAEPRRGQNYYGNQLTLTGDDIINSLFNFKDSHLVHYGSKLAYDSDNSGTWSDLTGSFDAPSSYKIRSVEASGNLYFTTDQGIQKLDSISGTPVDAGAYKALGGSASVTGSSGFMSNNTQIAYRIVWGYEDANKNLILGAPSQRILVSNSAGASRDVSLTFQIPSGVTTSWLYQIYRSDESTSSTDEPNDELQLVVEGNPTSSEITAKSITLTDSRPNDLKGAFLYTSPSQEGILQANDVPPLAKAVCVFKDCVFYANTVTKNRLFLNLIAVGGDALKYETQTGDTTDTSDSITNLSDTTDLRVGMRVVGSGIPDDTVISSIDSGTAITISNNATATDTTVSLEFQDRVTINGVDYWAGSSKSTSDNQFLLDTSGTAAEDIENSAKNFIEVFNESADNTELYAYYLSSFQELPGQILIEERDLGGSAFEANSTYGDSFEPILPSSGSTVQSDNETRKNRVYYSKPGKSEAVPILQYFELGSSDKEIKQVIALREAIIVLKDDGFYRIYGEYPNFSTETSSPTDYVVGAETFVSLNNKAFGVSSQGVISISESGQVDVLSLPIEKTILEISDYSNFESLAFGIGYESDRKYILFVPESESATYCTEAYVYNFYTQAWTRWEMARSCGIVSRQSKKLILGNPVNDYVYQERKNYDITDYADESFEVTITSSDSYEITLSDATGVEVGQSISQGNKRSLITAVDSNTITVDNLFSWTNGTAEINEPYEVELKTLAIDGENPGLLKHFTNVDVFFLDASFNECTIGFESNKSPYIEEITLNSTGTGSFGELPFGTFVFGGSEGGEDCIPTYVPLEKARAHWLKMSIKLNQCFKNFQFTGYSMQVEGTSLGGYKS